MSNSERESMDFDVVIVGGGPAGLAAAIRLKQLSEKNEKPLSVCLIEKGAEIGAHILSGAVIEPRALDELLPDWRHQETPIKTKAGKDRFLWLSRNRAFRLPTPPQMHNKGNFIVSLGLVCRWLGEQAEKLGVEIYPGFAAAELLYHSDGSVKGIATGDMGLTAKGEKGPNWQQGIALHARLTLFAEGCRGSLAKTLFEKFDLRRDCSPQSYAIGIKELWEIDPVKSKPGEITHTVGWPLDRRSYGGSFLYHMQDNLVSIGFVVGLDYENPHFSPYMEFQRFKHHPVIARQLEGGRRIAYGARALNEGGLQAIPNLVFPGGALIGCSAGFLNVPKIKGSHTAMKSGMLAAEAAFDALIDKEKQTSITLNAYPEKLRKSWLWKELKASRNIRPAFRFGFWFGLIYSAIDTLILRGKAPWTLSNHHDHLKLKPAKSCPKIDYPKPDGILSFDRLTNLSFSGVFHEQDRPAHLVLKEEAKAINVNLATYNGPEQLYCPAGVYEYIADAKGNMSLKINAQNCVHCKTCDIKDPEQNINWTVPEGGSGPNYPMM